MSHYTEMNVGECTVVGMVGKAQSGKNYLALHGLVSHGFLPLSLAMAFKAEAVAKHDRPIEQILGGIPRTEETRRYLQQVGTEQGRLVYGEDIWTNTLTVWLRWFVDNGYRNFVITDVRFPNEAEWVRSFQPHGHLVHVTGRGGAETEAVRAHSSENALADWTDWDLVLDNSVENGHRAVRCINHMGGKWKI